MFRHGEVSTEVDRKPFIFTAAAFIGSVTAAVLLFVLGNGDALGIFAGIMFAIVGIASGAVLFAMVTDRTYVEDGMLHMSYLFRHRTVALKDVGKVSLKDDVYSVFNKKGVVVGTINAHLTGIGRILHALDQNGIQFV
ncbi:MAG: hypothetical protein IJM50_04500 [Lachnospiraceae bacterium]|nr:hypothetical protein [Lachnospiraceae bacterium]